MTPSASISSMAPESQQPIRAELFSAERLEQHAESLAAGQAVTEKPQKGQVLTPRVLENGRILLECYRTLAQAVQQERTITPAAEWLVDNFFIVDEQIRDIRDHLPAGYYRKLPKLASGHLEGYPRVFGVAWAFVAHTDSRFDVELLRRFVNAYQRVQPLAIGELWALPITLRIVLVENLRRLAQTIVSSRSARQEADALADRLIGAGGQAAVKAEEALSEIEKEPLAEAFAVQLLERLRDLSSNVRPVLLWLDHRLAEKGLTADEVVRAEHQQQAAMNVTVRNIITSMRMISSLDWHDFFESVSPVDEILSANSNFSQLTFATRDSYRHAIEDLARHSGLTETAVARMAAERAEAGRHEEKNGSVPNDAAADPGYYLISRGRLQFEREIGFQPGFARHALRLYARHGLLSYLGTIVLITAAVLAFPFFHGSSGASPWWMALVAVLALIPASDLAIALVNRFVTDLLTPRALPRLDLKDGVPEQLRTIVVIPTLLTKVSDVEELVGRLEVHYLANAEGHVHYALLSDWADAAEETATEDDSLLLAATEGIARLNRLYGPAPGGGLRFLLFHRRRVWNASERRWIGWERKRGKLHELNRFLRGSTETTFLRLDSRVFQPITGVRYVLTVDSDTRMPRGSAHQLIGTLAHPLNRAVFSPEARRVVQGYGVAQPRITPSLPTERQGTIFQRIFSGPSGIDPYPAAISDVYQDLFHEGSYTGKGLYEIDAFENALSDKVPENILLSHDLFEGTLARTALVTDVEFFEEYPASYAVAAARQDRWARGDWQLLPWIFGHGPKSYRTSIPGVGRWKMWDNLRRSLSAPSLFLALLACWLIPSLGGVWTRFILATIAIPAFLPFFMGLNPRRGISKRSYLHGLVSDMATGAAQTALTITFLSYQAWLMADAILRTLCRFLTRKHLLEWITAAQAKRMVDLRTLSVYLRMRGGVILALAAGVALLLDRQSARAWGFPFVGLWLAAPLIARWVSLPPALPKAERVSASERKELRLIARRTWRFFETLVSAEDHYLPPDNFQVDPKPRVAHRTSPTNMGLSLLATLAAHDFGWIGISETVDRVEKTLHTMDGLERFHGHFFNWYDTQRLQPLVPKYVSSVDSGNLAGHLLTVTNGLRGLEHCAVGDHLVDGLDDNIELLREALANLSDERPTHIVTRKQVLAEIEEFSSINRKAPREIGERAQWFLELRWRARTLADVVHTFAHEQGNQSDSELQRCADAVLNCAESHFRDAEVLIPGLAAAVNALPSVPSDTNLRIRSSAEQDRSTPAPPERARLFDEALAAAPGAAPTASSPARLASSKAQSVETEMQHGQDLAVIVDHRLAEVIQTAERMFHEMDFKFLFDPSRKLFSIGYRATEGVLDASCYDLLASEARLTSFVAIAKGDAEPSHWFRLGRSFTPVDRASALISWSGSMFEYLMPALVMRSPAGSVLHLTNDLVVRRQIGYGAERHVPWGVSESAFNARDLDMTYQYSGFGIPGLGLKRGLSEDLVIAPYATALAAMVDPSAAARNLRAIAEVGGQGTYGFYEALDYTKTRVPEGQSVAVVHTYMVHHQGMSLISLANVVHDDVMQDRFHAEPIIQATELLLQERTPRDVLVAHPRAEEVKATAHVRELVPPVERRFTTAHGPVPRTQLLSNGKYAVMVTAAGSGYSLWGDIAITRWHEDATRDASGFYIYLRDAESGHSWSAGYQPRLIDADRYQAAFYEDRVEISRRDGSLATKLEVVVSSEDDAEIRCLSITNLGARERQIQVTSYGELCLTTQAAYLAHPAFSNLFVETEFHEQLGAIVATRRRQSADQNPIWLSHTAAVQGKESGELEYDTDRSKFIGRGRTPRAPVSVTGPSRLSKTVGPVLDPIISLRRTVRIAPGKTARVVFATAVAPSRDQVLALADKYRDPKIVERILTMAWTQAQVQLRHLNIDPVEANLFQRLANFVLYPDSSLRPAPDILSRTPSIEARQLWGYGISGDLPIVVVFVDQTDDIGIIRQMLRAHEYWRIKQLAVDLVVINDEASSYDQELHGSLAELVRTSQLRHSASASPRGDVFLLRTDLIPPNVRIMLESMAHAVLVGRRGPLADQVTRAVERALKPRAKSSSKEPSPPRESAPSNWKRDLEFFNGLGGFSRDGREYVVHLSDNLRTPQPWVNVIANASCGFITSESGSGYTWSLNSRERQLTPWSNDPVGDPAGEVIYIRDEAEGVFWTPTALPIHEAAASYVARHGQGYTRFENDSHGIRSELLQFVPLNDTIKISRLRLENNSNYVRRLSITAYLEWVLGNMPTTTARYVVTELDSQTHALFARSLQAGEFGGRVAFADLAGRQTSFTGDRREFLGRNGLTECPVAIERGDALSGKVGAGLDPCAALQTSVEIRPGARAEIVVFIGDAASAEDAQAMLKKYRAADLDDVLAEVISLWDNVLNGVQVRTPDRAMDLLLNRWLLYQTLSCRVWGRAAFYQVSGAYGFRDQLQDVMALCVSKRDVAREHLLRAAGRQFAEGDVQHWWHPPSGRGVRTKISDDPLWLPYAVSHWIERTGDTAIFDEPVPFLEGDPIPEGHADSYFEPRVSEARATVFEHCARAIDSRLAVGTHGLPLMGTGDWNDGMNRVGEHGKGESVWLGWFLHAVLSRFAPIATERGEHERAQKWRLHMSALKAALEREAWDGEWYLRAFYDDGWPLGSRANNECRIDSIAQSWGVISRAAETGRAQTSVESVYTNLVDPTDGLVLLLTPPFGRVPPGGSESTNPDTLEPERARRAESPGAASVEAAERVYVAATGAGTRAQSGPPAPGPISTSIDARSDARQADRTNGNSSSSSEMRQTTDASGPMDRVEASRDHDPGYIKGYVPGIRENGGQYTHAAVWNILAFVMLGDGDRALELLRMLNPITHASSRVGVQRYKVEPYVIAGDVYSEAPHVGRGGWTWYTGSAGWLYRVAVETILGFQLRGMSLRIDPCISRRWLGFEITFRYHSAIYDIRVENPSSVSRGVALTRIDGVVHAGIADIPLANDAKHHEILIVLG
jgi:cyclic beta-1,2-glucan synthetase